MKYYCHFNETEINPKECETCGASDCCEHNLEKMEDKERLLHEEYVRLQEGMNLPIKSSLNKIAFCSI